MPGECHVLSLSLSLSLSLYCHWFSFYVSLTHTHTLLFKKEACLGIYSVVFVTWNLIEHLRKTQEEKRFIRVSHTQKSYRSMQDISGI